LVLTLTCLISAFHGIGVRDAILQMPENQKYFEEGLFWFFLSEIFYCISIILIKLSISYMLLRIANGQKAYVWSLYVTMVLFTSMNLIACFYVIFQCWPVSAAWNLVLVKTGQGKCLNISILADIYYASTAVNIATAWFTALMPIPLLWNVKLNINSKISVGVILGLGIL
jgi:hypothetical protein